MKRSSIFVILSSLVILFVMNIFFGSVHIAPGEVWNALCGKQNNAAISFIVLQYRVPQAVTALLVGASLAVAGLILQIIFHNPLAGPSVLGISGGASLGVAVVMLGASVFGITVVPYSVLVAAFAGAMIVTALLLFLNYLVDNKVVLLIVGLLLGYLISSVISILNVVASAEGLHNYAVWGMGDFSSVQVAQLPVFIAALSLLLVGSVLMIKTLNALQLGDSYAHNLGVNLKRARYFFLIVVGGITAITTAYCGPVSFIGLAVPHIARMVTKTDNARVQLPTTLFCGAIIALLCNLLCCVTAETQLPLNAVTPVVGIPVILYVILKRPFSR